MTIDQTHMVHEVLTYVYGAAWNPHQTLSSTTLVPMISGIQHEEALASFVPYSDMEMKLVFKSYGFEYRTLLGQFQHLWQWMHLDIQTAVQRLAQYQKLLGCSILRVSYKLPNIYDNILIFH